MKYINIIVLLLLTMSIFVIPASAYIPPVSPVNVPVFDPYTYDVTASWINDAGDIDAWLFINSLITPYSAIFGQWIYIIIYSLYLFTVWSRSNNLILISLSIAVTLPLWYTLFPITTWYLPVTILALGIASMLYKLFKRR